MGAEQAGARDGSKGGRHREQGQSQASAGNRGGGRGKVGAEVNPRAQEGNKRNRKVGDPWRPYGRVLWGEI